jgi:DNA-binding NarL/FixJ family response regulator
MSATNQERYTIQSIMLADDDVDDHELFHDALKQVNGSLIINAVKNGEELMNLLEHYVPHMLFIDLEMPSKNGLECIREIRSKDSLKQIPVVVFSSTSKPSNIITAYEVGADLYFIKPASFHVLVSSLKAIMEMDWTRPNEVRDQYYDAGKYVAFNVPE